CRSMPLWPFPACCRASAGVTLMPITSFIGINFFSLSRRRSTPLVIAHNVYYVKLTILFPVTTY
ncbi:hypothetical protein ACSZNP_21175, partial [Aeromonas hydrophila]